MIDYDMKDVEIVKKTKVKLKNPILICGLPDSGFVGKIASYHFAKGIKAEKFADMYSSHLPAQTIVNEDGTIEIIANVGIARIQVIDSTGSISGNGEIVIRKLDSDTEEFLITEWNGSDVRMRLPEGRYLARLESENIQGETEFEIFTDEKEVLILVDSMYGMSTNIWIFTLSTIITIEIVIIYTIWKKNIKGI